MNEERLVTGPSSVFGINQLSILFITGSTGCYDGTDYGCYAGSDMREYQSIGCS